MVPITEDVLNLSTIEGPSSSGISLTLLLFPRLNL